MENNIINKIFENHHNYYKNVGVETIKQQAAQYRQVSDAYQGRVIFELLQNAIDKADKKIYISIEEIENKTWLLVANDGNPFSYNSQYNYEKGVDLRCDFQSLCSIATSTKDAVSSIGNKGVGFKSVFSISKCAHIYTNGHIHPEEIRQNINFTIFDTFQTEEELNQFNLQSEVEKLRAIKTENGNWGIPGYYFPMNDAETPARIRELLSSSYVTVVAVPLSEDKCELVRQRINDMQNYQFNFVCEKESFKDKHISLVFRADGQSKVYDINKCDFIVSKTISETTFNLAKKAGLKVSPDSKVSICFRKDENGHGYIYNFMPTEQMSFIKNVDFNADFQTSVDRRSINMNTGNDEPIGNYNYALMRECLELYKECLLDSSLLPDDLFKWSHITITPSWLGDRKNLLRDVFYNNFPEFVTRLLKVRGGKMTRPDYEIFYTSILRYISHFHLYGESYAPFYKLASEVGDTIKRSRLKFLPDINCAEGNEILFRENSNNIDISSQIKMEITSFRIPLLDYSENLRSGLGIKDFDNIYEVLKLYKQCDQDGTYDHCNHLSEDEQVKLIASVARIMSISNKDYDRKSSCWRIGTDIDLYINNQNANSKLRAGFALSSLFYKTVDGVYKPAQMVRKTDIDHSFLKQIEELITNTGIQLDNLLKFTGVSLSKKYYYADARVKASIKNGLNFIPGVNSLKNSSYSDCIENIRIITERGDFSPAIVNENYSFFINIQRGSNNRELNELYTGNYDLINDRYAQIIKSHLRKVVESDNYNRDEILRFYQKYFFQLYNNEIVLVKSGKNLRLLNKNDKYIIVSDRYVLNIDILEEPILCYIPGSRPSNKDNDIWNRYRETVILFNESMSEETDTPLHVGEKLSDKNIQAQILLKVSRSKISERDYEDDIEQRNIIFSKIENLTIYEMSRISGICRIGKDGSGILIEGLPFLSEGKNLYVEVGIDKEKSKNNVARALSRYLFFTDSLSDIIELVLFSKCWVNEKDVQQILSNRTDCYLPIDIHNLNPGNDDPEKGGPSAQEGLNWEGLADYSMIEHSSNMLPTIEQNSDMNKITDVERYSAKSVSCQMENTGVNGEMAVVKYLAEKFMKDFALEERANAISKINEYLTRNGFQPIFISETQEYNTVSDIAPLLWYTLHYKYAHFDIVTIEGDNVKLIEVKSTDRNNLFRLSKTESKVAIGRPDNYCLFRVNHDSQTIVNYGNPFSEQLKTITANGLEIKAAGYEIISH